jgi:hypothetical protein
MGLLLLFSLSILAHSQTPPTEQGKASVEGQVTNAVSGEGVRKANVSLRPVAARSQAGQNSPQRQPDPAPITVATDAAGKFTFTNLEPGSYQLLARKDGFATFRYGARIATPGRFDPIIVGPGDRKTGVDLKITPFGVITGRVLDQEGDPIRSIEVAAMTFQYTSRGRQLQGHRNGTTNDVGEYRIFDVPQGKYFIKTVPRGLRVSRNAEDAESYMSVYYPGVPEASAANAVEVGAGREIAGIDFMLRKARYATIRGRIVAPEGATNLSAGLMTTSDSGTSTSTTSVEGKDGKFEIVGVAPGLVYLVGSFVASGQRHWAQLPLQVTSEDISGIALNPIPPMDVTGRVRIEGQTSTKPSEVRINLEAPGRSYGNEAGGVSDDGRLTFRNVDPNVYRVVPGRLADLYLKSVQWGSTDVTDSEVDLTTGLPPRTDLAIVLGADGGQIEGAVEDEKAEPAPSAVVVLVPESGHRSAPFYKNVTASAAGHFTINGIAPGSYRVYAWDKVNTNAVIYDSEFLREYDALAKKVEVSVNEKKKVDLKLIVNRHPQ